jgi:hypothetical protein
MMGGLDRAPQTPQRSERPGKPVALLELTWIVRPFSRVAGMTHGSCWG